MDKKLTYEELEKRVHFLEKLLKEKETEDRGSDGKEFLAKQAELIRNEALFRGYFDHMTSGSGIYEVINDGSKGSDYIIKEFNNKSLEIEGKTLDEVIGKSLYDLRPNIDDYGLIPVMRKVWETGEPDCFPVKIYQDENFSNYYENYIFKIPTGEVVTIYNDVTQQKQAEAELRQSEQRHELAMQFTNDGLFDWNLVTNQIYYNPGWKKLLGYEDHEIKNEFSEWERFTEPEDVKKSWKMLKELLNKKIDRFETEFKMKHKDGHWVDILSRANALFNDKGEGIRVIGTHVDITERKKSEEALRESEERFRQVYEHMSLGIARVNLDFVIQHANTAYCEMLGYTEEELKGKHLSDITKPDYLEDNLKKQSLLATGKINHFRMEKAFIHKEGHVVHGILDANLVHDSKGKPSYFLGSVLDITEKVNLEKQLQQVQKMDALGNLAGGIAHDFNNILGIITGNISYALSQYKNDPELNELLSDVQEGTREAQLLTHQLLTFARGGEPIKKPHNINQLLTKSTKFITSTTKSKCLFDLDKELLSAKIDSSQITQVISNLIINADQAMPQGGHITIKTENIQIDETSKTHLENGNYIRISIADQGLGIPEKYLTSIFDPFFTTKQEGSGLGLATAYSIVQKHNGHIDVFSDIGKGTTFEIYLPASSKQASESEKIIETDHQGQGRILVMDDNEAILKMVQRMLTRLGYETEMAVNGTEAISKYRNAIDEDRCYDLVILDLTVPGGLGGAQTIVELIKINPDVKAIVSSGYSNDPIMAHYEDYGFCGVVPKPYTKAQLTEVLNKVFKDRTIIS